MTRSDAATILRGLIPQGCNLKSLPRTGKDEITDGLYAWSCRQWPGGRYRGAVVVFRVLTLFGRLPRTPTARTSAPQRQV